METAPFVVSDRSRVFVVHGRQEPLRQAIFDFLRAIGLQPIEWSQAIALTRNASPFIGEILEVAFQYAQTILVLLTGDDETRLREELQKPDDPDHEKVLSPQARPNVLFEAGLALGKHPTRTVLVEIGAVKPFSDIAGRHIVQLDNSVKQRQELAQRLEQAGCPIDLRGTDWHHVGNFEAGRSQVPTRKQPALRPERSKLFLVSGLALLVTVTVAIVAFIWSPLLCILYPWNAPRWEVAHSHVLWVFDDRNAMAIYDAARANGWPKYQAVLEAQCRNPDAQQNISWYGEICTECFISSLGHDWKAREWEAARSHIHWVFDNNPDRMAIYNAAITNKRSKYQAILAAQFHSPKAQESISQYGKVRTELFISSLGH